MYERTLVCISLFFRRGNILWKRKEDRGRFSVLTGGQGDGSVVPADEDPQT